MNNKGFSSAKSVKKRVASKGMIQNDKADFRKSRKILKSVVSESAATEAQAKVVVAKKVTREVKTKVTFSGQPTYKGWMVLTKNSVSAIGYNQLKKGELVKVTEYPSSYQYAVAQTLDGREALVYRGDYRNQSWSR